MATQFSAQAIKLLGTSTSTGIIDSVARDSVKPDEQHGRVRIMRWKYTVPAATALVNDVIILGKLPIGARVIMGREFHSAMTTAGAAATVTIGTYTFAAGVFTVEVAAQFLAATSVDGAGQTDIAATLATGAMQILPVAGPSAERWVGALVTVEAWAAAGNFEGFLLYVID